MIHCTHVPVLESIIRIYGIRRRRDESNPRLWRLRHLKRAGDCRKVPRVSYSKVLWLLWRSLLLVTPLEGEAGEDAGVLSTGSLTFVRAD